MQPSILKSVLFVALGITSAAAQSFSATKWYKCCKDEECTDCLEEAHRRDDSSCLMCQWQANSPTKDVSSPSPSPTYTPPEMQTSALYKMLTVKVYRSVWSLL